MGADAQRGGEGRLTPDQLPDPRLQPGTQLLDLHDLPGDLPGDWPGAVQDEVTVA